MGLDGDCEPRQSKGIGGGGQEVEGYAESTIAAAKAAGGGSEGVAEDLSWTSSSVSPDPPSFPPLSSGSGSGSGDNLLSNNDITTSTNIKMASTGETAPCEANDGDLHGLNQDMEEVAEEAMPPPPPPGFPPPSPGNSKMSGMHRSTALSPHNAQFSPRRVAAAPSSPLVPRVAELENETDDGPLMLEDLDDEETNNNEFHLLPRRSTVDDDDDDDGGGKASGPDYDNVVEDDSLLRQQLDALEDRVELGSSEMLHHRRLPSTIYEDPSVSHRAADDELEGYGDDSFFRAADETAAAAVAAAGKEDRVNEEKKVDQLPAPDNRQQSKQGRPEQQPATVAPLVAKKKSFSFDNLQQLLRRQEEEEEEPQQQQQQQQQAKQPEESPPPTTPLLTSWHKRQQQREESKNYFSPVYASTRLFQLISRVMLKRHYSPEAAATWVGFWVLLQVSCSNHVLTPLRDAIALQVGIEHMPTLTLVSTVLAFGSSVPIGWLFEAPDPSRRRLWKRMGLSRGETQGTSLALFYRFFALTLVSYAIGFQLVDFHQRKSQGDGVPEAVMAAVVPENLVEWLFSAHMLEWFWQRLGKTVYIAFFLVVHLMKLHSTSLVWGVTTEAMEYEEVARSKKKPMESNKTRLQRLALVGFGGTMGGILGSILTSFMAYYVRLPGLLLLAAFLLEISAELSIELGRIMQKHWEEQQLFQSSNDLASLDASMRRSVSMGSMKRVASGNSLNRIQSATDLSGAAGTASSSNTNAAAKEPEPVNDNTFMQRLLRGVTTIIRSRLLMAIFTYNALYASTNVLLSFQRAELVVNRSANTTAEADTAFLARINMASSVAIFTLQASGMGAFVAHKCGSRGTLVLMPLVRLLGVLSLAWWHQTSNGQPPSLILFLVVDETCKVMNLAIAKPVRESLWRGLSNEARYEAKPIVDTLANRWGGGSAAFLVSVINRTLDLFGVEGGAERKLFGFPPILFLCIVIAAWWTAASADLGHIRKSIDLELKKRQ